MGWPGSMKDATERSSPAQHAGGEGIIGLGTGIGLLEAKMGEARWGRLPHVRVGGPLVLCRGAWFCLARGWGSQGGWVSKVMSEAVGGAALVLCCMGKRIGSGACAAAREHLFAPGRWSRLRRRCVSRASVEERASYPLLISPASTDSRGMRKGDHARRSRAAAYLHAHPACRWLCAV